jgi:hypothetical protein
VCTLVNLNFPGFVELILLNMGKEDDGQSKKPEDVLRAKYEKLKQIRAAKLGVGKSGDGGQASPGSNTTTANTPRSGLGNMGGSFKGLEGDASSTRKSQSEHKPAPEKEEVAAVSAAALDRSVIEAVKASTSKSKASPMYPDGPAKRQKVDSTVISSFLSICPFPCLRCPPETLPC